MADEDYPNSANPWVWGGIEAGGTKIICALGAGPDNIQHRARIATAQPGETIEAIVRFFQSYALPEAIGVGSFGPVDLNRSSLTYGHLLKTPKPGWQNIDLLGQLSHALPVPMAIETDVNVVLLAEQRWGAARGIESTLYLTIGTGIGGAAMVNGRLVHGLLHPEMGHVALARSPLERPDFNGSCPYHRNCLEGFASGTALHRRWGQPAESLPPEHPAWALEVDYLAQALENFIYTLSPQRIVLGGGVMAQGHLFEQLRRQVEQRVARYLPGLLPPLEQYIVPPQLGHEAGVLGAIALAQQFHESSRSPASPA